MTTPTHVISNLVVVVMAQQIGINLGVYDLFLILLSNLIDLDHLFSRPVYHPRRNPFVTHFLHKNWKIVLALSVLMFLNRNLLFLGIGLILHFFLDYVYVKREKI